MEIICSNREFTVRAQDPATVAAQSEGAASIAVTIERVLKQKFGENNVRVARTEAVGPRVGSELKRGAIIAILLSFLITLVYLSIRFEWRFATAAVIALTMPVFSAARNRPPRYAGTRQPHSEIARSRLRPFPIAAATCRKAALIRREAASPPAAGAAPSTPAVTPANSAKR